MRYIFFDTETTGLEYEKGERVFEIGCVEVIDRKKTGRTFHKLLNPGKALSEGSKEICKITDEELIDKPPFCDISDDLLHFIKGDKITDTVLLAHNAKFDIGFVNNEFKIAQSPENLDNFKILDTLYIARVKFPGTATSLNALCKKFEIDLSGREQYGHGALLDSDILADVFIKMCADDDDQSIMSMSKAEKLFFGINKREDVLEKRDFELDERLLFDHNEILTQIKSEGW